MLRVLRRIAQPNIIKSAQHTKGDENPFGEFDDTFYEIADLDDYPDDYIMEHDFVTPEYVTQRRMAYDEAGVTAEALVVALVEAQVEGRDEKLKELQVKREEVKRRFPKGGQ